MTLLMIKKQQLLHAFQQNYKITARYAKAFTNLDFFQWKPIWLLFYNNLCKFILRQKKEEKKHFTTFSIWPNFPRMIPPGSQFCHFSRENWKIRNEERKVRKILIYLGSKVHGCSICWNDHGTCIICLVMFFTARIELQMSGLRRTFLEGRIERRWSE